MNLLTKGNNNRALCFLRMETRNSRECLRIICQRERELSCFFFFQSKSWNRYYETGEKYIEGQYAKGILEGEVVKFYKNGKRQFVGQFEKN